MSDAIYVERAAAWAYECTAANQDFDAPAWDDVEEFVREKWRTRAQEILLGAPRDMERARTVWRGGGDGAP